MSTCHHDRNAEAPPGASTRQRGRHGLARVLVGVTLWIPPALLAALLIAGPVSASGGGPVAVAAGRVPRGPAATERKAGEAAGTASCAVVILPLPSTEPAGPTGAPQGSGSCLAAANPSAPRSPAAGMVPPNAQVVTQSIGQAVLAG